MSLSGQNLLHLARFWFKVTSKLLNRRLPITVIYFNNTQREPTRALLRPLKHQHAVRTSIRFSRPMIWGKIRAYLRRSILGVFASLVIIVPRVRVLIMNIYRDFPVVLLRRLVLSTLSISNHYLVRPHNLEDHVANDDEHHSSWPRSMNSACSEFSSAAEHSRIESYSSYDMVQRRLVVAQLLLDEETS
jgi:hypothetical protein